SLINRRRISPAERQVPMIEQCMLWCMSQIAVRLREAGGTKASPIASPDPRDFIGIMPRGNVAARGWRPFAKMLDSRSGVRDEPLVGVWEQIARLSPALPGAGRETCGLVRSRRGRSTPVAGALAADLLPRARRQRPGDRPSFTRPAEAKLAVIPSGRANVAAI